ncbi:MAG: hypothetical protein IPH50_09340 [Rhodanobacteraceae bacterium]|nr:hypothetical protein [Rhodanobacteraceae bacterium]
MTIDIAALQKQAERALQQGDANTAVRNAREILAAAPEYAPAHLLLSNIAMFGRKCDSPHAMRCALPMSSSTSPRR